MLDCRVDDGWSRHEAFPHEIRKRATHVHSGVLVGQFISECLVVSLHEPGQVSQLDGETLRVVETFSPFLA